jgi:uncharacterized protein YqhQ
MKKNTSQDEMKCAKKMTSIGGQALMEGLMMIGPATMAMAVRLPNGEICVETAPIGKSSKAAKIPFIRGCVKIFRQMVTGTRYLMKSAQFLEDDIISEDNKSDTKAENVSENTITDTTADITTDTTTDTTADGTTDGTTAITSDSTFGVTSASTFDISDTEITSDEDFINTASEPVIEMASTEDEDFIDNNSSELSEPQEPTPIMPQAESVETVGIVKSEKELKKEQKRIDKEKRGPGRFEKYLLDHTEILLYFSAVFGIMISIGLFILLPNLIANLSIGLFIDKTASITNRILFSLTEGVLRISIFIGYLAMASKIKDIKRVWMYHGAEHKTIACYEAKMPLNVENVRTFSKHHPRCGTAFMFIVLLVSIIIFSFVPRINIFVDMLIRLACVPILAGISYEIIHWAAKHDNVFTRALSWPGLMLQRLTTKEPDDSMLEVAIAAMIPVIPAGERGDEW